MVPIPCLHGRDHTTFMHTRHPRQRNTPEASRNFWMIHSWHQRCSVRYKGQTRVTTSRMPHRPATIQGAALTVPVRGIQRRRMQERHVYHYTCHDRADQEDIPLGRTSGTRSQLAQLLFPSSPSGYK
ncbi:hypothetical protein HanRHA438_Chr03g0140101 [Helianthus annuus]|nr:hypothetical protein HanRHA438_Chr03g0140101 [Helianthus annuus]